MPIMKSPFGEDVNIPNKDVQMALNSGYTYVSAPQTAPQQSQPISQPQPVSQPQQPVNSARNALSGRLAGIAAQLDAGQSINRISLTPQDVNDLYIAGYTATQAPGYSTGDVYNITSKGGQASQLPKSFETLLDVILNYLTSKPASNFRINPDLGVTEQDMARFLSQARQELQPYYGQLFQQTAKDLQTGLSQISEDIGTRERQLETQANQQLGNLQESFAQRGLTFSSRRAESEKSLIDSTRNAIEEGRRQAERRSLEAGTTAERTLGTQNLPQIPGIESAPEPIIRPGQLVFSRTSLTRPLFTPTGGVSGSLEQNKLAAETARQRELRNSSLEERGLYTK